MRTTEAPQLLMWHIRSMTNGTSAPMTHLSQVEEEGVAGEVEEVCSSLADADVAEDAKPPLISLLLPLLCAKGAHCT